MLELFLSQQKHSNLHTSISSCHPLSVKKGFVKGEALRLLRNNSVQESFENDKLNFAKRFYCRGYPQEFVTNTLSKVIFTLRNNALKNNIKHQNESYYLS